MDKMPQWMKDEHNAKIWRKLNKKRKSEYRKTAIKEGDKFKPWLKSLRAKQTFRCYWCGEIKPTKSLHLDHMQPLILGGAHEWSNVCISCNTCNLRKNDTPLSDWNLNNAIITKAIQNELNKRKSNRIARKFIKNGYI